MESEGPYNFRGLRDFSLLTPTQQEYLLNAAYAEGRKSAEKDFKELLKTTEYVVDRIGDSGPFGQLHALEKFRAWKAARGIE